MNTIALQVRSVQRRQQWQWAWQCMAWGLVAGGIVACALGVLRLVFADSLPWTWITTALAAGPVAGGLWALLNSCSQTAAARAIDSGARLKDRASTALRFLGDGKESTAIRQLQIADAEVHLRAVEPKQIAPIAAPRPWWWGVTLAAGAIALIAVSSGNSVPETGPLVANPVVVEQAERLEENLAELEELQREQPDEELAKLLEELTRQVDELKTPGLDPKEALAKLSEMEAALTEMHESMAAPAAEAALQEIGKALSLAEALATAGKAMEAGKFDEAAEALEKMELPDLDRQTEKALTEELKKIAEEAGKNGQKKLAEAANELCQSCSGGDKNRFKEASKGLAGECRNAGRRKKIASLLRKQCQCLGECKSECESECESQSEGKKKGGSNWGTGASGNEPGDPNAALASSDKLQIKGQQGDSGETDVEEVESGPEEQQAQRGYRQRAAKHQQLGESALENEPIPPGQRQIIRRYFQMIRPQAAEMDAVVEQTEGESTPPADKGD